VRSKLNGLQEDRIKTENTYEVNKMDKKNGTNKNNRKNATNITMLMQLFVLYLQQQIELTAYELESVRDWNTKHGKDETDEDGNGIAKFTEGESSYGEEFTMEWI